MVGYDRPCTGRQMMHALPMEPDCSEDIDLAVSCDVGVLISGGSRTEALQLALAIHLRGPRADERFGIVDMTQPSATAELQTLAARAAAHAEALDLPAGMGTLCILEPDRMPHAAQAALLQCLARRDRHGRLLMRVIAVVERARLARLRESTRLVPDVFYRLNTIHVALPAQ
ncbi:MAG: sigma 54-interacting transcriptional regulator [Vicinamibacterales bacterium]